MLLGMLAASNAHTQDTMRTLDLTDAGTLGMTLAEKTTTALFETIVHDDIARNRKEHEYLLLGYGVSLAEEGKKTAYEIVTAVKARQRSLESTLRTAQSGNWEINARLRRGIIALGSALGATSRGPGVGVGVSEIAETALDIFEDSQRNKRVHYSLQLRADELIFASRSKAADTPRGQ